MKSSTLSKASTACAITASLLWLGFLYYISRDGGWPRTWMIMSLGLASMSLLNTVPRYLFEYWRYTVGYGDDSKMERSERRRTVRERLILSMLTGAMLWASVVFYFPRPSNVFFEWLVPASPLLRGIHVFLSPFVCLAAACLNLNNDSFWRHVMRCSDPPPQKAPSPAKQTSALGWALLLFALLNWLIFVLPLTVRSVGLWDLLFCLAALLSPCLSVAALYLQIKNELVWKVAVPTIR